MAFNKVVLLGNLTRDPETRSTTSGASVTSISIAVSRSYVDKNGERKEETSFIECDAWGKQGETVAKYFSKGRQILVSGRLRQDSWEDKETGKKRSAIRVVIEEFSFVNDGKGAGASGGGSSVSRDSSAVDNSPVADVDEPIDLSDIPF
ncbi:single-stranded DNA-binding protein [Candidatus Saccharibacteria bacterium]|nr:single-stranded DNA-binding protein [Candidatus Saccharibacteria bacterium]MCL1963328.1 single-stranded DNA-binding protein [Candidatus Saccharibacteria bacterium]